MIRRPVAVVTAIVLFVEAGAIAWLNWFLGIVVDRQDMSLAGLDPAAMSTSSKAGGVVFGLYFAVCGLAALLVALRDRPATGVWRILLISAAVVHGLLGAFAVGLVGWGAFTSLMVVLGLVLLTLMTYDRQAGPAGAVPEGDAGGGPDGGGGEGGAPGDGSSGDKSPGNGEPAPVTPPAPSTP